MVAILRSQCKYAFKSHCMLKICYTYRYMVLSLMFLRAIYVTGKYVAIYVCNILGISWGSTLSTFSSLSPMRNRGQGTFKKIVIQMRGKYYPFKKAPKKVYSSSRPCLQKFSCQMWCAYVKPTCFNKFAVLTQYIAKTIWDIACINTFELYIYFILLLCGMWLWDNYSPISALCQWSCDWIFIFRNVIYSCNL